MKHIQTFKKFLNEEFMIKDLHIDENKMHIAHIKGSSQTFVKMKFDKDFEEDYNLKVVNKTKLGFDIIGTKEDIQSFVHNYSIFLEDEIEVYAS